MLTKFDWGMEGIFSVDLKDLQTLSFCPMSKEEADSPFLLFTKSQVDYKDTYVASYGAVHILRQPKSGVHGPPLPQQWSAFDLPPPPRQLSSAFARRPFCTTIFEVDFFAGDINLYGSNLHVTWL